MADDDLTGGGCPPTVEAEAERIKTILAEYEAASLPAPASSPSWAGEAPAGSRPGTAPLGRLATRKVTATVVDRAITEVEAELQDLHDHLASIRG